MLILFCKIYLFLKILIVFIDTKIDFKNLYNIQILLFLLKAINYQVKQFDIIILI